MNSIPTHRLNFYADLTVAIIVLDILTFWWASALHDGLGQIEAVTCAVIATVIAAALHAVLARR